MSVICLTNRVPYPWPCLAGEVNSSSRSIIDLVRSPNTRLTRARLLSCASFIRCQCDLLSCSISNIIAMSTFRCSTVQNSAVTLKKYVVKRRSTRWNKLRWCVWGGGELHAWSFSNETPCSSLDRRTIEQSHLLWLWTPTYHELQR